jgi:hypothetical protein
MQEKYFLRIGGILEGPFTADSVEDLHGAGKITRETPCQAEFDREWKTVDDHVPRAKWVTAPQGIPPTLKAEQKTFQAAKTLNLDSRTGALARWWESDNGSDFGRNAVVAGIVCVILQNICSQLMQGYIFGIAGALAGVTAVTLGRLRAGILVLVTVAGTFFLWEMILAAHINAGIEDVNTRFQSDMNKFRGSIFGTDPHR